MFEIKRTPNLIQNVFSKIAWQHSSEEILLTFDDGPDPKWTLKIANLLSDYGLRGLFFVIGENVEDRGIITELSSMGHTIGWHSEHHTSFFKCNANQIISELEGKKRIEDLISEKIDYFRFPYGHFFPWQIRHVFQQGLTPVMWSYMVHDYKSKPSELLQNQLSCLKQSDILLYHDRSPNMNQSFNALKHTIEQDSTIFATKINIAFSVNS